MDKMITVLGYKNFITEMSYAPDWYVCEKFITRQFHHCKVDQNRTTDSCGITTLTLSPLTIFSVMVTNFYFKSAKMRY